MKEIQLKFNQEELNVLIQRVFLGEYIVSSDDESEDDQGYVLLQKILRAAETNKMIERIETNELDGHYLVPYAMEEELINTIDEYNEDIFVNSLIDELVQNDMRLKYAPRLMANMNDETYERLSADFASAYEKEIEKNGFSNLRLKETKE